MFSKRMVLMGVWGRGCRWQILYDYFFEIEGNWKKHKNQVSLESAAFFKLVVV